MPLRAISLCLAFAFLAGAAEGRDTAMWERYKQSFLSEDGRVVAHAQDKTSHSEGQGYGMQLAFLHDDRVAFEKLWQWTRNNLQLRSDSLFAWHWGKRPNGVWAVLDFNNATDGDILIAFALLQAGEAWRVESYRNEAFRIIRDIRTLLAVNWNGRTFLLPGYFGFDHGESVVLNPSYLIFPAFRAFGLVDQAGFWNKVRQDGLFLIEQSCFGSLCLTADWVALDGDRIMPAPGKAPYFGAEAVRVLLVLATEDASRYPKGVSEVLEQYRRTDRLPLWFDLEKDSASLKPAVGGYYALYALAAGKLKDKALAGRLWSEARERLLAEKDAYYSFSLFLLASGSK